MEYAELYNKVVGIENVESANYWSKGDHERLYVNVKSQNRFGNSSKIYVDLKTNEVVADLKKGQSGVKSYKWSVDVAEALKAVFA